MAFDQRAKGVTFYATDRHGRMKWNLLKAHQKRINIDIGRKQPCKCLGHFRPSIAIAILIRMVSRFF